MNFLIVTENWINHEIWQINIRLRGQETMLKLTKPELCLGSNSETETELLLTNHVATMEIGKKLFCLGRKLKLCWGDVVSSNHLRSKMLVLIETEASSTRS